MDEVEGYIKALGDKVYRTRVTAAAALGNIGDPRAVEPLIRALGDEETSVRVAVERALGQDILPAPRQQPPAANWSKAIGAPPAPCSISSALQIPQSL